MFPDLEFLGMLSHAILDIQGSHHCRTWECSHGFCLKTTKGKRRAPGGALQKARPILKYIYQVRLKWEATMKIWTEARLRNRTN